MTVDLGVGITVGFVAGYLLIYISCYVLCEKIDMASKKLLKEILAKLKDDVITVKKNT